ncbi:hypothetical protein HDU67_007831 [Dinochytrium kinnereticum]|nr:hypothetical protein HDU67_007831 [Dinochytrium kinnereticum]
MPIPPVQGDSPYHNLFDQVPDTLRNGEGKTIGSSINPAEPTAQARSGAHANTLLSLASQNREVILKLQHLRAIEALVPYSDRRRGLNGLRHLLKDLMRLCERAEESVHTHVDASTKLDASAQTSKVISSVVSAYGESPEPRIFPPSNIASSTENTPDMNETVSKEEILEALFSRSNAFINTMADTMASSPTTQNSRTFNTQDMAPISAGRGTAAAGGLKAFCPLPQSVNLQSLPHVQTLVKASAEAIANTRKRAPDLSTLLPSAVLTSSRSLPPIASSSDSYVDAAKGINVDKDPGAVLSDAAMLLTRPDDETLSRSARSYGDLALAALDIPDDPTRALESCDGETAAAMIAVPVMSSPSDTVVSLPRLDVFGTLQTISSGGGGSTILIPGFRTAIQANLAPKSREFHMLRPPKPKFHLPEDVECIEIPQDPLTKKFYCPVDGCVVPPAIRRYNIKTHLYTHYPNVSYRFSCTECDMAFTRRNDMKRHLQKMHDIFAEDPEWSGMREKRKNDGPKTKGKKPRLINLLEK